MEEKQIMSEIKSLIKVWLTVLASLIYCYSIASKLPKGKLRLLSLLPIFFLFTLLPLSLSTILPTGITALFITWLANFKLILFAFDLGPLKSDPPLSLLLFASIACFPIKMKQNKQHPSTKTDQKTIISNKSSKLPPKFSIKILLYAVLLGLSDYQRYLHPKIILSLYCVGLYLFIDILFGVCNVLVRSVLGIELELPSNEPYFSTSLQDFWGRRWNLMVTNALRHTVYKPVRSILDDVLGREWAPVPAVLAAFLVSGLMHELLYFYISRATPTWEVTWFFVLHGVCLVVEIGLKGAFGGKWRLHWAVSGPLTVGFVVVTAVWLFFPQLVRNGVIAGANEEREVLVEFLKSNLKWALSGRS